MNFSDDSLRSFLFFLILIFCGSSGRTSSANCCKFLAVPLLVGLNKTRRIWKAFLQTVRFLILNFAFLNVSMTYGSFWKKGLVWPKLTLERLRQNQEYEESYVGPQTKSFRAHCVLLMARLNANFKPKGTLLVRLPGLLVVVIRGRKQNVSP